MTCDPCVRAVVLTGHGGIDQRVLNFVPVTEPRPDEALVRFGACAINNTDINFAAPAVDRGQSS